MQIIKDIRNDIISGNINISELSKMKDTFFIPTYNRLINRKMKAKMESVQDFIDLQELEDFIMICLDYYTYSEYGDVLITDPEYNKLMNVYIECGFPALIHADIIKGQTMWTFIKHEVPGMVGSVNKIYLKEELEKYLESWRKRGTNRKYVLAPKFDGVSTCIKVCKGRIMLGVTRNSGYEGQNITQIVANAHNTNIFKDTKAYPDGYYKCELVVTQTDFIKLLEEKSYANRRSATSGIVNTPKNLYLAKYITIIPLVYYDGVLNTEYIPPDSYVITDITVDSVLEDINKMLFKIRSADYEVRTDGTILYPIGDDVNINLSDVMDTSIAFKVNTEQAYTTIDYGYVSVGRLGYAVPMVHVKPVEVNETRVTDVSLSSFDKYAGMDLREGEKIIVYSAGNVIPQLAIPERREYKASAPMLKIRKRCPYCNEKLTRLGNEYKCTNSDCIRVKSGQIVNFLVKLKVDEVADGKVESLYAAKLIDDIPSIFDLKAEDIQNLEGYGETSADNIIKHINELQSRPIPLSTFIGALGIQDISEKKCRNIFKYVSLKDLYEKSDDKLLRKVVNAENTGLRTAEVFVDFVKHNRKLIKQLADRMNIVNDITWKGNVVFTGFRNPEYEQKLNELGYELSDSVNKSTIAVVAMSYNKYDGNQTGKIKNALAKNIDILQLSEIDTLINALKRKKV